MNLTAWALSLTALVVPPAAPKSEVRLGELAAAVLRADYRGDRTELARLDEELGRLDAGALNDYRDYWRGFALWRRTMNGFNETPPPPDLDADLRKALERFRSALALHPDWSEVKSAMVGCWGNRIYLAGNDAEKRKKLFEESGEFYRWVMQYDGHNPRVLWIKGGLEMIVPSKEGEDPARAAATLRRGVEGAWRESLAAPPLPAWAPKWGGPENLMNLAFYYTRGQTTDRTAARAYAEGALTAVPEWRYVKTVLLPKIEAMQEKSEAAPAAP
jgi:hypothetical protein